MEQQLLPVTRRLILPIGFALLVMALSFFLLLSFLQHKSNEQAGERLLSNAQRSFEHHIAEELRLIRLLSDILQQNNSMPQLLLQQDSQALLLNNRESFETLRMAHQISHFYFHNADGFNLIRLHSPERSGGFIGRYTMQQAMRTFEVSAGIELGIMGTLTLRVVSPVRLGSEVVGYLELGKELKTVFTYLEDILNINVAAVIHKEKLHNTQWQSNDEFVEQSKKLKGLGNNVLYFASTPLKPLFTQSGFDIDKLIEGQRLQDVVIQKQQWRTINFAISTANGESAGQLLLFQNLGSDYVLVKSAVLQFFVLAIILIVGLIVFLRRILLRVDNKITWQTSALQTSQANLEKAQQLAKMGSWSLDVATQRCELSIEMRRFLQMAEVKHCEDIRPALLELCHPDDREQVSEVLDKLLTSDSDSELGYRVIIHGDTHYILQRSSMLFDEFEQPVKVNCVLQDVTESVLAEQQKLEREQQFRHLLESTAAIPWRLDVDTFQFNYVGPQAVYESGYSIEQWCSTGFWRDHVHPQDLFKLGLCKQAALSGRNYSFEFRFRHKNGQYLWFNTDSSLVGQRQIQGFMFNVNNRRQQELLLKNVAAGLARNVGGDFLQQLSEQLHNLFHMDYVFIAELDKSRQHLVTIVFLENGQLQSQQTLPIDSTPHQQVIWQSSCTITSELTTSYPKAEWFAQQTLQSYVGCALSDSEGEVIGVIAMMAKHELEEPEFAAEVLSIFATRAAAELEQTATKQRLFYKNRESQEILDSLPDSIIKINSRGIVTHANRATEQVFGYKPETLLGENIKLLTPQMIASRHDDFINNYLQTGEAKIIGKGRELRARHKDGHEFPIRATLAELPPDINGERYFVGCCSDMTEQYQRDSMLRQSQKMDAVGQLTSGVAHDYNNLLGIIMGYAEIMEEKVDETSGVRKYIQEINHSAERGAKLARKLLAFSRNKAQELLSCDLNERIGEQLPILESTLTSRIKLTLCTEPELWRVLVDPSDFDDALLNLIINSQHAMAGEQGKLTITTANIRLNPDSGRELTLPAGEYVSVSIADSGKGMDEETREHIFEPFFTTKGEKGTGLGLSMVYGFVKRSAGEIKVNSTPGKGCEFVLFFPRYAPDEMLPLESNSEQLEATPGIKILVVDDEVALAKVAAEVLQDRGYLVDVVFSATAALENLAQDKYDLVFSDVIMPEMDGYQLAEQIKQLYPETKLLLTSGNQESHTVDVPLLGKPYTMSAVVNAVEKQLS